MMMVMEFVVELFFTASLSVCLAYIIVQLVSMAGYVGASSRDECVSTSSEKREQEEDCRCSGFDDGAVVVEDERLSESVDQLDNQVEDQCLEKAEILLRQQDNLAVEESSSNFEEETDVKALNLVEVEEIPAEQPQLKEFDLKLERREEEILSEEVSVEIDQDKRGDDDKEEEDDLLDEDDDWEGIEKNEVEKLFSSVSKFVGSSDNSRLLANLGNEVQMQLYGLHKVAMEGPCREQAPMALMVSARAKWNAWQRLGNMTPEVAMEQYVTLLSGAIPGWMGENHQGDKEAGDKANVVLEAGDTSNVIIEAGESKTEAPEDLLIHHQPDSKIEREPEDLKSLGENRDAISL